MWSKTIKMKHHAILIILCILLPVFAWSQKTITLSADQDFKDQKYSLAIDKYKKAYTKTKRNKSERSRIRFQMAECYRMMNQAKKAEATYKGLVKNNYYKENPLVLLQYANILKANQNLDEAITQYELYVKLKPEDPRGANGLKSCTLTKEWMANPTNDSVYNIKTINSRQDDFAPGYLNDQYNTLVITSNRDGSTGKSDDDWTGMNFTDLFLARQDRGGKWSTPDLLDKDGNINSETNEGVARMNSNFNTLYFTRCGNDKGKKNGCHIYTSARQGRSYDKPQILNLGGDSSAVIGHPALSADECTIIFAADFPGGQGGKDLFIATRSSKSQEFDRPKNMGPSINTPEDEMYPFLRNDTALYFASNGHPGMGGLDNFKCSLESGEWGPPVNLGYPMNSYGDDFGIVFSDKFYNEGYFSSNREGGKGGDDVWAFVRTPLIFTLAGVVKDDRTLQYIPSAEVKMVGSDGSSIIAKTNSIGRYEFNKEQFLPNTTYELYISKEDYFSETGTETTVGVTRNKNFTHDFILKPIPKKPIVLPEILYDLAKWDLKTQYQDSLQGLIKTLDDNEKLVVELASHTDFRDTDENNDILSQRRAQSVVDYLVQRGIDPDRLVAKGYGERVPRILENDYRVNGEVLFPAGTVLTEEYINALPSDNTKEVAHQLNRRTEFTVLRNDFVPKPQIGEVVTAPKIDIVVNPGEETTNLKVKTDPSGRIYIPCDVNRYSFEVILDKKVVKPIISREKALTLLREGAISKGDFEGDPNVVLAEGSIADKAVFKIAELKILKRTITNISVVVDQKMEEGFFVDEKTFSQIGDYTFDEAGSQIIFK